MLNDALSSPKPLQHRDFLHDTKSKAESIGNSVATAIPSIVSQAESIINPIATAIPEAVSKVQSAIDSIETSIRGFERSAPKNCSIGTQKICIGSLPCQKLPLNISMLVPDSIPGLPEPFSGKVNDAIQDSISKLQSFADRLSKATSSIRTCFIAGSILMIVVVFMFICLFLSRPARFVLRFGRVPKMAISLFIGVVCCIPFIVLVAGFQFFQARIKLPSWIEVHNGEAGQLCIGLLCCALFMTLLTALIPIVFS